DPMLLRRMIRNLVENAHLHGEPPIEVTVARQNDRAVLNVLDHGPVIAEDARERLFSAFYRIPGRGGGEGSGLGPAVVRQKARRRRRLRSRAGKLIHRDIAGHCLGRSLKRVRAPIRRELSLSAALATRYGRRATASTQGRKR